MKTRKVGRVLSLLLAIAMVVGLMIPASSVLAQTAAEKYPGASWETASTYKELKTILDNATSEQTTYVKLGADIAMPQGPYIDTKNNKGYFYGEVIKVEKGYKLDSNGSLTSVSADVIAASMDGTYFASAVVGTNPYDESESGYLFLPILFSNLSQMESSFGFDENKWDNHEFASYYDVSLVVWEGTNVVIDLNGKTINGNQDKAYTGTPAYTQTIFIVKGSLTIDDFVGGGKITGGTGYLASGTYSTNGNNIGDSIHAHRTYKDDWTISDHKLLHNPAVVNYYKKQYANGARWHLCFTENSSSDYTDRFSYWIKDATEARGGAVYVEDGGNFTLENGSITKNCAWMEPGSSENTVFKSDVNAVTKGGGVYVEAGATFNMYGGEVTKNAARSYNKKNDANDAHAYGGGVYLADAANGKFATFNMYGGKISENAAYSETQTDNDNRKSARTYGAGIYVGTGSVCNIMGAAEAKGATTEEMLATFPQITDNSCGSIVRKSKNADKGVDVLVQGAGIYCAGTLNIKKAVVSSNDFTEYEKDLEKDTSLPSGNQVVTLDRDPVTGLPQYIYSDGTVDKKVTRLDPEFTENLEISTKKVQHEVSGIYGIGRGNSNYTITSDGAGVYLATTARMNVGERTWIIDNYDLVTTGHQAFSDSRHFTRHWDKNANGGMGSYVYDSYSANAGDGYTWSDTRDDVYLPEGVAMYKGETLFECKIGINYYDMVDKAGVVGEDPNGRASNRVIVKSATDLDPNVWGTTNSAPVASDIQFFSLNDNNKNYERDNYSDLPERVILEPTPGVKAELLDLRETGGKWNNWDTRYQRRVAVVNTSEYNSEQGQYRKAYLSPYEGYVNFDTIYPAGTWSYWIWTEWNANQNGKWPTYDQPTYWKNDPEKNPVTSAISNTNVVFPQRAYQIDAAASQLSESEQRARFMDYKVVYDDNAFGSMTSPVLRFGKEDRIMYATITFDEAHKSYYGVNTKNQTLNDNIALDTLVTTRTAFTNVNLSNDGSSFTFYGANKPTGTIEFKKVVPDYSAYKGVSVLNERIDNRKTEQTSITKTNGIEDKDLYFKGWSFYSSYGYGPEIMTLKNSDALEKVGVDSNASSLYYRGTFTADLSRIFNSNVNAQPCPSMTAIWYTQEELAEARRRVSNVMGQTVIREDGTKLLRVVSIAGTACMGDDCDAVGFVISTTNATPTFEGGYDYVAKSRIYEKLGKHETADDNSYYDTHYLLTGSYTGNTVNIVPELWSFTEGSEFANNVTTGTYKAGYKDAGLFYANIVITDENKDTVYFVTPYAKFGNTYYYGESRAVCYADHALTTPDET